MDNNNRSKIYLNHSPKKFSDKRMFIQYKKNVDKKKSMDIDSLNFKSPISNQTNKVPLNIRSTFQGKIIISKIIDNNNENNINFGMKDITNTNREKPIKKDKNYYLNLLNDIYLNETHLSNKNGLKRKNTIININNNNNDSIKVSKDFIKKQTLNFSKIRGSSKNLLRKSYKSSKRIFSTFRNEKINKSNRMSNNGSKDNIEKSNRSKKPSIFNKNAVNKRPIAKFLSENFVSKFQANEELSKIKMKESIKNIKSSQNVINEIEYINDTLKDEKNLNNMNNVNNEIIETIIKEVKPIKMTSNTNENQIKNNTKSRNVENDNLSKCFTKINSKNISNNKSIKVKKVKKMYKTCFFCCLIKNDDSLSDNN